MRPLCDVVQAFVGPAPRALLTALHKESGRSRGIASSILPTLFDMVRIFNQTFCGYFDAYTYQMLPCLWVSFLAQVGACRRKGTTSANLNKPASRLLLERVFYLETLRMKDLRATLEPEGLWATFVQADVERRRALLGEPLAKAVVVVTLWRAEAVPK